MQLITATGSMKLSHLSSMEEQVMSLLARRSLSMEELMIKTGVLTDASLPLARL